MTKPWYLSRTLLTNIALLVVFVIGLIVQAAGIYQLSPEIVTGLGIVAAAVNFVLRLMTHTAVEGTPAAATLKTPPH